ncbi:hypothetical protein [Fulvivirga sediminis]|uniref:STAS/SEC14 domain-containing protein n=1 Tax=Fulvivirga sediminis TaxID=2803949 RepID=A0A937F6E7_9BACT|nr:hypothetical protein [Fulvivirga sediminis]MBL3656600.1 hypothetical protein [Fulvivirga sediminis]
MKLIPVEENDRYVLSVDEEISLVCFKWESNFLSKDIFKEVVSHLSEFVLNKKPSFLLIDSRKSNITITDEIQKWHDDTIVPRYIDANIKGMAVLNSESIFSDITHKKTFGKEKAKQSLKTEFFSDEKEALDWFNNLQSFN